MVRFEPKFKGALTLNLLIIGKRAAQNYEGKIIITLLSLLLLLLQYYLGVGWSLKLERSKKGYVMSTSERLFFWPSSGGVKRIIYYPKARQGTRLKPSIPVLRLAIVVEEGRRKGAGWGLAFFHVFDVVGCGRSGRRIWRRRLDLVSILFVPFRIFFVDLVSWVFQ